MDQEQFKELEEAAKPLIDYLNKYHNPMTSAIVTEGHINIVESVAGLKLEVRD